MFHQLTKKAREERNRKNRETLIRYRARKRQQYQDAADISGYEMSVTFYRTRIRQISKFHMYVFLGLKSSDVCGSLCLH